MSEAAETSQEKWWLPRIWALFVLLLVAVTFRLWLTVPTQGDLPLVPLIGRSMAPPPLLSLMPSVTAVIGLTLLAIAPHRFRKLWWLVAGSLLACFVVDQHRLQPWAYQSAIYALVFATMGRRQGRRWLIPLAASIYLYSAAGKFDYQFAHTVGQEFLEAALAPLGGLPAGMSQSTRASVALLLPTVEWCAAGGLLLRRTRAAAAVVVMLMHAGLIVILGPWGRDHSYGVLVWNVLLIIQAYLIFLAGEPVDPGGDQPGAGDRRRGVRFCQAVVLVALAAPLVERLGYWDHWVSWSLYSPHTSRTVVEIHPSAIARLDLPLRSCWKEETAGDRWRELDLGRWSLACRGVPIYPQARYQLTLAWKVASQHQLTDQIRARRLGVADRWTGQRSERWMLGRAEIERGLDEFWLTRP